MLCVGFWKSKDIVTCLCHNSQLIKQCEHGHIVYYFQYIPIDFVHFCHFSKWSSGGNDPAFCLRFKSFYICILD